MADDGHSGQWEAVAGTWGADPGGTREDEGLGNGQSGCASGRIRVD